MTQVTAREALKILRGAYMNGPTVLHVTSEEGASSPLVLVIDIDNKPERVKILLADTESRLSYEGIVVKITLDEPITFRRALN